MLKLLSHNQAKKSRRKLRWFKKPKIFTGIDLNAQQIRLLTLSRPSSGFQVNKFLEERMPEGAFVHGEVKDKPAVIATLRQVRTMIDTPDVVAAIPNTSVITKTIQLDSKLTDRAMEEWILLEASNIFPQKDEEMSLDFCKLNTHTPSAQQTSIMLVAARTKNVESRRSLLEEAGFNVRIMDVDSFALANACYHMLTQNDSTENSTTIAIFNIEPPHLTLVMIRNGLVIYTQNITLEEEIAACHTSTAPTVAPNCQPSLYIATLTAQIQRALKLFYSANKQEKVSRIMLTGSAVTVDDAELIANIQQETNIPAMVANPFDTMLLANEINKASLQQLAPAFMVSLGLALRGFDNVSY